MKAILLTVALCAVILCGAGFVSNQKSEPKVYFKPIILQNQTSWDIPDKTIYYNKLGYELKECIVTEYNIHTQSSDSWSIYTGTASAKKFMLIFQKK